MLLVKKRSLLCFAGSIWCVAGFKIAMIGFDSIALQNVRNASLLLLATAVFFVFYRLIFSKMVKKHTHRIHSYVKPQQPFYNFFDKPAYLIMAGMMSGGIAIRSFHLLPYTFIAFFYTGLGIALSLSGLMLLKEWFQYEAYDMIKKQQEDIMQVQDIERAMREVDGTAFAFHHDLFIKPIWGDMGEDVASITITASNRTWIIHFIRTQNGEPYPLAETVSNVIDSYEKQLTGEELYAYLTMHQLLQDFQHCLDQYHGATHPQ